jgi:hypothetical protein
MTGGMFPHSSGEAVFTGFAGPLRKSDRWMHFHDFVTFSRSARVQKVRDRSENRAGKAIADCDMISNDRRSADLDRVPRLHSLCFPTGGSQLVAANQRLPNRVCSSIVNDLSILDECRAF